MKIKRPGDGRCQGDNPNKEDDESGTTSGDLKTHGETDGQNPGETKRKQFQVSISLFSCFVLHTVDCLMATSREKILTVIDSY